MQQMMRAQFSSGCASLFDFVVTALMFRYTGSNYVVCTIVGAVAGGILNCGINYRWTFGGTGKSKKSIAWRYVVVWIGSILFNMWGVTLLVWLATPAGCPVQLTTLMYSKIAVAVIVALSWNFTMQKRWVYKV